MATAGPTTHLFLRVAFLRVALSMVLSATLVAAVAAPSTAQPGQVPDPGARPAPSGQVPMPGAFPGVLPGVLPPPREQVVGPLAAEIAEVEIEIDTLSQQLQSIEPEVGPAGAAADLAEEQWLIATDALEDAQAQLDELVDDSYRAAAALPADLFLPQLPGLSAHAPVPVDPPLGARTAARDLVKAQEAAETAAEVYQAAVTAEQTLGDQREELEDQLADLQDELEALLERNAEELVDAERAADAAAQDGAAPDLQPVNGFRAHPDAVEAVEFALSQLGKPYLWGAEGPDRYDCSGLMWAAYRSVGHSLPRVAADQYWGTRDTLVTRSAAVAQQGLLPGDLVFFSSGPSWHSIHHVGMYIGNGQMVHAPNRNDVVKVSPVWWSRFFAATRVVGAVRVPGDDTDPTPSPSPTRTPRPTPGPTPTPTRTPTPGPTTPTPSPTTPTPDPTTQSPDEPTEEPTPDPTTPTPEEPTATPEEPTPTPEEPTPSPEGTPVATPS